jgi:hypothetical protein
MKKSQNKTVSKVGESETAIGESKTATKVREGKVPRAPVIRRTPVPTMPEIAADALVRPLLVSRRDAAVMLGKLDVSSIKRLERMGVLHPMRLNPRSPAGQIFFQYDEVVMVARGYAPTTQQATADDTKVEEKQPRARRRPRLVEGAGR